MARPYVLVSLAILALALPFGACGSSGSSDAGTSGGTSGGGTTGGSNADAGPQSACGHPGDQGNSKGVGQFCTTLSDCPTTAPICSTINNSTPGTPATYFCVLPCNTCSPAGFCGADASCVCQNASECGCVPNTCSTLFPDGGNPPCTTTGGTTGGTGTGGSAGGGTGGSTG